MLSQSTILKILRIFLSQNLLKHGCYYLELLMRTIFMHKPFKTRFVMRFIDSGYYS